MLARPAIAGVLGGVLAATVVTTVAITAPPAVQAATGVTTTNRCVASVPDPATPHHQEPQSQEPAPTRVI